jgi:hypothetical protein
VALNDLSPDALKAAMLGGQNGWGEHGSIIDHICYVEPRPSNRGQYRKCHCGCSGKATFSGKANGIAMASGCELSMRRWARERKAEKEKR